MHRTACFAPLAAAALLAAAPAAHAQIVQGAVVRVDAPFTQTTAPLLRWSPAVVAPEALPSRVETQVRVTDLTSGGPGVVTTVPVVQPGLVVGSLEDGHRYELAVRTRETVTAGFVELVRTSPWSVGTTTVDVTIPLAGITIDGGARFTNRREVTLDLSAGDPGPAGLPASGVATAAVSDTGDFACTTHIGPECPVPFVPRRPHTLTDGPDGPRTVTVRVRDAALPLEGRDPVAPNPYLTGNVSGAATATIVLDRLAPSPVATVSAGAVPAGTPVTLTAGGTDGAEGPADSGIDPGTIAWQFGDGTAGTGARVSHTYAAPGVYEGTLSVRDRAGNPATATFRVRVDAAAAGSAATPAAPVRLGAVRLLAPARAGRLVRLRVNVSDAARVDGTLTRGAAGRAVVVRRFSAVGGPGAVTLAFRAPRAGVYRVAVTAGGATRSVPLRIHR